MKKLTYNESYRGWSIEVYRGRGLFGLNRYSIWISGQPYCDYIYGAKRLIKRLNQAKESIDFVERKTGHEKEP